MGPMRRRWSETERRTTLAESGQDGAIVSKLTHWHGLGLMGSLCQRMRDYSIAQALSGWGHGRRQRLRRRRPVFE